MRDTPADNDDLGWPLSGRELDDVDILELVSDDGGQLSWRSEPPPGTPESFREWMPKRRSAAPDQDLPLGRELQQPDAARHTAEAAPPPDPPLPQPLHAHERAPHVFEELLPTRLDMSDAPAVTLSDLLPDLWPAGSTSGEGPDGPAAAAPAKVPAGEATPPRSERTPGFLPMTPDAPLPSSSLTPDDRRHLGFADWEDAGDAPLLSRPHDPPALASTAALAAAAAAAKTDIGHDGTTSHTEPAGVVPGRPTAERVVLLAAGLLIGAVVGLTLATSDGGTAGPGAAPAAAVVARGPERPAAAGRATVTPRPQAPPPATERSAEATPQVVADPPASPARPARPLAAAPSGAPARPSARPAGADPIASTSAAPSDVSGRARANHASEPRVARRASRPPARPVAAVAGRPTAAPTSRSASVAPPVAVPVLPAPPTAVSIVREYAAAYSRLDARAAQALWPTVNRQALIADFSAVREQRLTLSGCKGQMVGVGAAITCDGVLRYRPRVGDHSTRLRRGLWRFALAPAGDTWRIDLVTHP